MNQRKGRGGNNSQIWAENTNMTMINTCRKYLYRAIFLDDNILFGIYEII